MTGNRGTNRDGRVSHFDPFASDSVQRVLDSQILWRGNGPNWGQEPSRICATDDFEDAFAEWCGLPFVHAVNSGTSANEAAVVSLGLDPGTEVVCPAASPIFVPFAVLAAGCIPVFADVDPQTLAPTVESIKRVVNDRTGAIVVVHLWGRPAPIEEIVHFARQHNLKVIEDCAQAPATTLNGRRMGTFGDVACFSLHQSKLISAGEGGVFATADRAEYARAALYSNTGIPYLRYGISPTEGGGTLTTIGHFGHNHRMSELQAAVALSQLQGVEKLVERREEVVSALEDELDRAGAGAQFRLPPLDGAEISYWRYPVRVSPAHGNYHGVPPLEPFFQHMEATRRTPYGLTLPDHVSYSSSAIPGTVEGSASIRVLPLRHDMCADDGRQLARQVLRLAE